MFGRIFVPHILPHTSLHTTFSYAECGRLCLPEPTGAPFSRCKSDRLLCSATSPFGACGDHSPEPLAREGHLRCSLALSDRASSVEGCCTVGMCAPLVPRGAHIPPRAATQHVRSADSFLICFAHCDGTAAKQRLHDCPILGPVTPHFVRRSGTSYGPFVRHCLAAVHAASLHGAFGPGQEPASWQAGTF